MEKLTKETMTEHSHYREAYNKVMDAATTGYIEYDEVEHRILNLLKKMDKDL